MQVKSIFGGPSENFRKNFGIFFNFFSQKKTKKVSLLNHPENRFYRPTFESTPHFLQFWSIIPKIRSFLETFQRYLGGSASRGAGFPTSAAECGRKEFNFGAKGAEIEKNVGVFLSQKWPFLAKRAKFCQFWLCGVSSSKIFRKFGKFSKSFGLMKPHTAKKMAQKFNKNENIGGWWNPTKVQAPKYHWNIFTKKRSYGDSRLKRWPKNEK